MNFTNVSENERKAMQKILKEVGMTWDEFKQEWVKYPESERMAFRNIHSFMERLGVGKSEEVNLG